MFPEKAYQLIAILCRAPGYRVARRRVASLLWDAAGDAAAAANLRQLLARVRKALPHADELVISEGQNLLLGPRRREIDLCVYQETPASAPQSERSAALRLFGGDLLASVGEATAAFQEWLALERAALRQDYFCRAEQELTDLTKFGRAQAGALNDLAARMLALDPEREATYRALIAAFGRNGMLEESARHLTALRELLARDHGAAPAAETLAVVRRVFSVRQAGSLASAPQPAKAWQPRVAFLAPEWPRGAVNSRLMKAFIEDVANELSRYRSFVVLAPHSSFQADHETGHLADNTTLRADYTISGFVKPDRTAGTLALRMLDCESSEIVWAGQFKIGVQELLNSFDALVVRVASSLAAGVEKEALARRRQVSGGGAYVRYLEGMQWLENCDLPRLRKARKSFKQSLSGDAKMASAAARIAQTLYLEWIQLGGEDPHLLVEARDKAQHAIDIDPNDPIGHWMDGTVALYQRDFENCEAKFAETETLCPNSPDFLVQYADALSHLGNTDTGWTKFERAIDLNPAPPDHYWWAGASIAFHRRDYRKTIELCERLRNDEAVLGMMCASFAYLGDMTTAKTYAKRIGENYPNGLSLAMSRTVPDRDDAHRQHSIEGLRLAGVT
ncbi:MAG: BTAD domain-containing putative transcriptional regulator [Micropepsaceae bacterium]